jgi:hypothetical protein
MRIFQLAYLLPDKFFSRVSNFTNFLLALPTIMYLRKKYKRKVRLVMFVTLSLLVSFYVQTFFVDSLSWAKLAKIGESMNLSGSTPGEKSSTVTQRVVQ